MSISADGDLTMTLFTDGNSYALELLISYLSVHDHFLALPFNCSHKTDSCAMMIVGKVDYSCA